MMRLKLKNEKIKIVFLGLVFGFIASFGLLYVVRLDVLAASSGGGSTPSYYTEFPLPYGIGTSMGYDSSVVDINQAVNSAMSYARSQLWSGGIVSGVYLYEYDSTTNRLNLFVTMVALGNTPNSPTFAPNPSTYPTITTGDTFSCSDISQSYIVTVFLSDYHCEWLITGTITNFSIGDWLTSLPNNSYAVVPDKFYYGYPLFVYDNIDIISAGGRVGFTYGNSGSVDILNGITGSGEGTISDGEGNVINNFNYNVEMDITPITDSLDTLHQDSQQILETTEDIRDWLLADNPSAGQIYSIFAGSDVFGPIMALGSSSENLIGSFSAFPDAKGQADMEGEFLFYYSTYSLIDDAWTLHSVPIHFDFTWYESIRVKVLTVLFVFLSLGFLFRFFRTTLPTLIQGTASVGESGKSIAESGDSRR